MEASRLGIPVSHSSKATTLENHGDRATIVVPTSTGESTVHSQTTKQQPRPKETNFVKDEYNSNDSSNLNDIFTNDYYEYEQGGANIIVKGRLKDNIQFWIDIGAYDFVIDTIKNGYKIPFYSSPHSVHLNNNLSATNNADFVSTAIQDLLNRGLIVQCDIQPFIVNPLTVSIQSNGKKRLILDLRAVNQHLWKQSVKFEDMRTARPHITIKSYMYKYDIHSAYHHIDIFEPHTDYLGFSWIINGRRTYFKFLVLPFGLSTACYLFTKMTRPLVKKWRSEGKQVIMYLDDGLGIAQSYELCSREAGEVKSDLIRSGFVPKADKSLWEPTRCLVWLGTYINTESGYYKIPDNRIDKLLHTLRDIQSCLDTRKTVFVRKVASFVGQVISMYPVIGNIAYLMTKHLTIDINASLSWFSYIKLSDASLEQLVFWRDSVKNINIKHFTTDESCQRVVYSDASDTGFGGYIVETPVNIAHGMWLVSESRESSTWKELTAVKKVLLSLIHLLADNNIKWFTDNQNVVSIVSKGSTKTVLQNIALDIFSTCLKYNVNIDMVWIPRSCNDKADYLSRIVDHDDWGISQTIFDIVEHLWGPHEVDWFASDHNFKLTVFYSRFWNEHSFGIDAFTVDWQGVNGLFVPPVFLIPRVLKYMEQCHAFGTLIVPCWPSASYWPMLNPTGYGFIGQVISYIDLPTEKEFYTPGKSKRSIFGNNDLTFRMLALRLDFRQY